MLSKVRRTLRPASLAPSTSGSTYPSVTIPPSASLAVGRCVQPAMDCSAFGVAVDREHLLAVHAAVPHRVPQDRAVVADVVLARRDREDQAAPAVGVLAQPVLRPDAVEGLGLGPRGVGEAAQRAVPVVAERAVGVTGVDALDVDETAVGHHVGELVVGDPAGDVVLERAVHGVVQHAGAGDVTEVDDGRVVVERHALVGPTLLGHRLHVEVAVAQRRQARDDGRGHPVPAPAVVEGPEPVVLESQQAEQALAPLGRADRVEGAEHEQGVRRRLGTVLDALPVPPVAVLLSLRQQPGGGPLEVEALAGEPPQVARLDEGVQHRAGERDVR